jgi:hypothetical protein
MHLIVCKKTDDEETFKNTIKTHKYQIFKSKPWLFCKRFFFNQTAQKTLRIRSDLIGGTMKEAFKNVLAPVLCVGLVCPQAFATNAPTKDSELYKTNFFAAAVYEDAKNAFDQKELIQAAYRLGLDAETDQRTFASEIARRGISELPAVKFENGIMTFSLKERTLSLEIVDAAALKMRINGKDFQLKDAPSLQEAYALNLKHFAKAIESSEAQQNVFMKNLFPQAHASLLGWGLGIGLVGIPLLLSIGKSGSLGRGTKNYVKRVGHLGKAVFWDAPKDLFNKGIKDAGSTLWGATKNLYKGQESDNH